MNAAERYARQTMLPCIGEEGQRRLAASSVLLVGVGGLGSPAALYLAGAGVGCLGLADGDTVSESNLQRQVLYSESQIGSPKTQAARERLAGLSSAIRLECYDEGLTAENAARIVARYDLVVDCCDNFPTRYLLDDVCAACGKPWVYGSVGAFCGQAALLNHRRRRRYADLYPDRESLCARPRSVEGVLGPVPGVIGAIQAAEAIKVLAGLDAALDGRLLTVDMLDWRTEITEF